MLLTTELLTTGSLPEALKSAAIKPLRKNK